MILFIILENSGKMENCYCYRW